MTMIKLVFDKESPYAEQQLVLNLVADLEARRSWRPKTRLEYLVIVYLSVNHFCYFDEDFKLWESWKVAKEAERRGMTESDLKAYWQVHHKMKCTMWGKDVINEDC